MYPFRHARKTQTNNEGSPSTTPITTPTSTPTSTPTKFKTPMKYKPIEAPSPSRKELWKHDLGLEDIIGSDDDFDSNSDSENEPEVDQNEHRKGLCSVAELQALEMELDKKEKQREEMLQQLKARAEKMNAYKSQLQHAEQAKRSQVKILKKTMDIHLQERNNTIQMLQELIEEQENKIQNLDGELKRNQLDRDTNENASYKSIKNLIDKVTRLEQEKADLTHGLLRTQSQVDILEKESKDNEKKGKRRYEELEIKYSELEKEFENCQGGQGKRFSEERQQQLNMLQEKNRELDKELIRTKEELALKMVQVKRIPIIPEETQQRLNMLEEKNIELEKDLSRTIEESSKLVHSVEMELNCTKAAKAELERKGHRMQSDLNILQNEVSRKQELEVLLEDERKKVNSLHVEVHSLEVELNCTKAAKAELGSQEHKIQLELKRLQDEVSQKQELEVLLQEEKRQVNRMQMECQHAAQSITNLKTEYEEHVERMRKEMDVVIKNAQVKADEKYSKLSEFVNYTKLLVRTLFKTIEELKAQHIQIKKDMLMLRSSIKPALNQIQKSIIQAVTDVNERSKILVERYRHEMALRKKFHNELVELKGNIRVFCRVRPIIREDGTGKMADNVVSFDNEDDGLLFVQHKDNLKKYEMDKIFRPDSTQEEVFDDVKSLVTSCLDGYNVCIFAFGQTGSGKTFTMEGTKLDPGINQRALALLFNDISQRYDWEFSISVSMMEIYNEMLRDLLGSNPTAKLDIKQGKDGMNVPGLNQVQVTCVDGVNEVFALGHRNRATASTDMNEHSSRSHALLVITVNGVNTNTKSKIFGKLNLIDLAGSERVSKSGAEGARMKEAQNINKSLSALGDVIHALKNKNQHIPYRNTKLTYLLQDSLGGDSKTLMVVQVAPVEKNAGETNCSLTFAQRVRQVELGQASRKVENAENSLSPYGKTPPKKRT